MGLRSDTHDELRKETTEKHTEQMENLIKSTTEAMKKMMELVQSSNKGDNNDKASKDNKKKKREEKCQKYNAAPVCKHCNKKHPNNAEDKCWELEKNAALHPTNWKSSKSTWGCEGFTIETETWQPGKVLDKIKPNHT